MPEAGTTISVTLRLAKALQLVRRGKLRDAQALIAGNRTIPDDPLALEALAALATGEGDYLRALKLWELLRQRVPGHPQAERMIAAIELWQERPFWMRYVPWVGWMLAAVLAILALLWLLTPAEEPLPPPQRPAPAAPAPAIQPRPAPPPPPAQPLTLPPPRKTR